MQNPAIYNVTMYQGASFDLALTWNVNSVPVNLTGYSSRMQVQLLKLLSRYIKKN